ncbi:MAG: lycopene cyclase family protein [Flavobacteriaceae bacterium]
MKEIQIYDYLIVGAGAAGLMLANAMALDPFFFQKQILLLDPDTKELNDRTWCFWEKTQGPLEALTSQCWSSIGVSENGAVHAKSITPYSYKMLEGKPFYTAMKAQIAASQQIHFKHEAVEDIQEISIQKELLYQVNTAQNTYSAKNVFDSRFNYTPLKTQTKYPVLQQHFIGWFIKTKVPVFNKDQAIFMDFSVPQKGNTRFMYVLPTSSTEALVEYTLFSKDRLPVSEYETAIKDYLHQLGIKNYELVDKEAGSIPMSCYPFHKHNRKGLLRIGTAGGWSKPSTGFTFSNTQKKITDLIPFIKTGKPLNQFNRRNRFWYYDLVLLEVLSKDNSQGSLIFEGLFKKRPAPLILKFLAEDTCLWEEIYIMSAANTWRFSMAFFRVLLRGL